MTDRWYISGPMTGQPDWNFPAFNERAAAMRAKGYRVVNPVEINPDPSASRAACLRRDIEALLTCTAVMLLPGWRQSRGARLEAAIGRELGLRVVEFSLGDGGSEYWIPVGDTA